MLKAMPNRESAQSLRRHISIWVFACTLGCATGYVPVDPEAGPNGQSISPQLDHGVSSDPTNPGGSDPANPEVCAPSPEAVSILPRSSNHEVWRLYSDLAMGPIDASLFAQWTPLAQVRGFDHMTESRIDAQTLEEQLRTTESVAEILVNTPEVMASCPTPPTQRPVCTLHPIYDAHAQFSNQQGQDCWGYLDSDGAPLSFDAGAQRWMSHTDAGIFIWRTGLHPGVSVDVVRRWTAPVDGQVTLQGSLSDADSGGGDGIISEIRTDDGQVFQGIIANGGAPVAFDLSLNVRRGETVDIIVRRNATNAWDSTGLNATLNFEPAVSTAGLDWSTCGRDVVNHVSSRAWRRPLRPEELDDLKVVFDNVVASADSAGKSGSFTEGLKAALQAALLSPHVQYKPEFVPGGARPDEVSYQRASRLALFFRGSFPDDTLWSLAASGGLSDETLANEASRLLAEDSSRFVANFGGQWLDFRGEIAEEETALARAMRTEANDVFAMVLDEELPAVRLLEPGFTVVNGLLAEHYGLGSVNPNAGPTQVMTNERGGLFEQGHFLTSGASGSDFKRVIHRGIYALNRTLCSTIPPLDPATLEEIAATAETIDPNLPLSERMEMHRESSGRCLGCHSQMDPLGLSLENFDAQGRWRDTYPDGSPIEHSFDFNGQSVRDPNELKAYIRDSDLYRLCVAEKLLAYGLHRAIRGDERCLVEQLVSTEQSEASLHDLAINAFLTSLKQTETP